MMRDIVRSVEDLNITPNIARLLRVFLEDPEQSRFGTELIQQARVSAGSLYPALRRMETAGFIAGAWEDIDPSAEGRPARRYYTLTADGAREARMRLAALSASFAPPPAHGWIPNPAPKGV